MSRLPSGPTLFCFVAAFPFFLVGLLLIPGAIENRTLARTSLFLLAMGLVLLMAGIALAIDQQVSNTGGRKVPGIWRFATVATWAIAVLNILFLSAFALVAMLAGALDDRDEAWDILIPQAATAIALTLTLLELTPWNTPPRASTTRRMASLLPVAIVCLFWGWWFRGR